MKVTTEMVKELRDATGAGVLDAKKALESTNGDFDKALEIIREKGAESAMKRADRVAVEGVIEIYSHPGSRVGVMLELNCETDFVARNEQFQALAHDLALHIAAMDPRYLEPDDVPRTELESLTADIQSQGKARGIQSEQIDQYVEDQLAKYYEETCLLEQPFVKDDSVKVSELILDAVGAMRENIVVRRFIRYELGEEQAETD